MSCKYSAEWWQKYALMTATSTTNGEKTEPVHGSELKDAAGTRQSGELNNRIGRAGNTAVLER